MLILTAAYILEATYIEKHFTLDKSIPGNDHYHSGDPSDFKKFTENIKLLEEIYGKEKKVCSPNEDKSRLNARRSIVSTRCIKKGEILNEDNVTCKRPCTGIPASEYYNYIGKKVTEDINEDTILQKYMFIISND